MVHAERCIIGIPGLRREQAIRRNWAEGINADLGQRGHSRRNNLVFLGSHGTAFACVGVKPGNGDTRVGQTKVLFQCCMGNQSGLGDGSSIQVA